MDADVRRRRQSGRSGSSGRSGRSGGYGRRWRSVRRVRALASLAVLGALLAGCASMPDEGGLDRVNSSHRAQADTQVRVYSVSPQKGETPQQIVRGFLEATTSDEANFPTAQEYLTPQMARAWNPFSGTHVLSSGPSVRKAPKAERDLPGKDGYVTQVTGRRMAEVDRKHAYSPAKGEYNARFYLTKVDGQWRIDRMPDGLVLGQSDFQRIYRPINNYYYAELGPDSESVTNGKNVLVADPVYLRRRINPVTETIAALLEGPTGWIDPVVKTAFPRGTRLAPKQRHLTLDDAGALTVRLNAKGSRASRTQCDRMAAQVLHSVQDQASAKVSKVDLRGPQGAEMCTQTREDAADYQPGRLNGSAKRVYFIDKNHRVTALGRHFDQPEPVEGALGTGKVEMGAVAVNRPEKEAAAVTRGRRSLYVASLEGGPGTLGDPVLMSKAKHEDDRLTAPSWDGLGDLWIADRDPKNPRLLRLRGGKEKPEEIEVPGLRKGQRIESVKIASDGLRIALRVREPQGSSTLQLGRVHHGGTTKKPEASVAALRPVAPQLEDVVAASWAGGSRLVVVGRESGSVQQLLYMETDGSASDQPTLPGINDVTGVAASEDENRPLLADSEDGIVRLPPDSNWRTLTGEGSAPVYPG
ncbi:LpqB family beta-propeller domain-containing protein [Streptomyces albiaxialis]|uniref:LpqB family beta-propeller domain-containing protein n=2 Tax=Streptomyces albiaxialis TaxID=329523 RepID=A0ABN2WGL1_9ACTN